MTIEYRSFTGESVEATDEGHVFGLAIPYDRTTTIGNMDRGGFRESIAPGACNKSLREADIVALNNHNSGQPLGRTSAGNLTLNSAKRGIEPDLVPIDTSYGLDLIKNVKAGIVRGWSFGFEVVKDDWVDDDGKSADEWSGTDRTIREMKLIEVSPVTFPAYDMTHIGTRSSVLEAREAAFTEVRGGNAPGDGSKPYGNVPYADPGLLKDGKKRYPLDNAKHAKAAWAYINVPANASQYNSEQLAKVKAAITAACKKFGVSISADSKKSAVQADEWRAKIEARKARKAERKAAGNGSDVKCPNCGRNLNCPDCAPTPIPKPGDHNVYGANHGVSGDVTEEYSAEPDDEERAAKASYSDVDTCADCGATGQYGAYCTSCGEPMTSPKTAGKFCSSCGAKLSSSDRAGHVCESRAKSGDLSSGTTKRIPQVVALLNQALKLFSGAKIDSLPSDVQTAVALVSSAATHASHMQEHEGLTPADAVSANDAAGRTAEPKPDDSTLADLPDEKALPTDDEIRSAIAAMRSREVELGL